MCVCVCACVYAYVPEREMAKTRFELDFKSFTLGGQ